MPHEGNDELIADIRSEANIADRPGSFDRLNAIADRVSTALRAEQSARQALQQRIDAARAILAWMPDHDGSDMYRVEQDYMYRAQLADEAYTALTAESEEPDPNIAPDECRFIEVDGDAVRVLGSGEWDAEDHAAFAEIVRAAKAHMRAEQIGEN